MQALEDFGQRQRPHTGRRQLDRQRQTVQARTNLAHRRAVVVGDDEFGPSMASAVGEQFKGLIGQ